MQCKEGAVGNNPMKERINVAVEERRLTVIDAGLHFVIVPCVEHEVEDD